MHRAHGLTFAIVVRHGRVLAGLTKSILGRQRSRAAPEDLAIEVEQLLTSPVALNLVLSLYFIDPRADARFGSERGTL